MVVCCPGQDDQTVSRHWQTEGKSQQQDSDPISIKSYSHVLSFEGGLVDWTVGGLRGVISRSMGSVALWRATALIGRNLSGC